MAQRDLARKGLWLTLLAAGLCTAQVYARSNDIPLSEVKGVKTVTLSPKSIEDLPEVARYCETARELLAAGGPAAAIEPLDEALRAGGVDCYEPLALLALAHWQLGNEGQALVAARSAVELQPTRADARFVLGAIKQRQERFEEAIAEFRTATLAADSEPDNPRVTAAWYHLGECLAADGHPQAAAEAYGMFDECVGELHPEQQGAATIAPLIAKHPDGLLELRVRLLREAGRAGDIVAATTAATKRSPEDARVARLHARALFETGAPQACWDVCERSLRSPENIPDFLPLACEAAMAAGTLDTWVTQQAGRVGGGETELALALARELHRDGHAGAAVPVWQALLAVQPADSEAVWMLARAWCARGELERSWRALAEFVRKNPTLTELPREPLQAWADGCAPAERVTELARRLDADPERDFATDFVVGLAAAAAGANELAEQHLKASSDARPGFMLARLAWPQLLVARYQWDAARIRLAPVFDDTMACATAHALAGEIAAGLDATAEAESAFKTALRLCPESSAYALRLAEFNGSQGDLPAAQRYYQQALSADPSSGEALEGLIDAYLAGGKRELAEAQLEQVRERVPRDSLRRALTTLRFAESPASDEHMAELRRQHDQYPDDTATGLRLATVLYVRGLNDEAYSVITQAHAQRPDDDDAALLMAQLQLTRLDYAPAIAIVERLVRRYPRRERLKSLLAAVYSGDFQTDKERAVLRDLLSGEPDDGRQQGYRTRLLNSYLIFGEYDAALALLDEWNVNEDMVSLAMRQRVAILIEADRGEQAVAAARAWMDAEPEDEDRRLLYAGALQETRDNATLETLMCDWREADPTMPGWLYLQVEALLEQDRPTDALEAIDAFQPQTVEVGLALRMLEARCDAAAGNTEEAVTRLLRLLDEPVVRETATERERTRQLLMTVLVEASEYDRALELCDQWWRQGPHDVDA
ncbi:MAG: tetratricopeptide repeat protein, partial [Phycisphaerae bacterium]|nr:tetratricopeptide repeat protein [Phycisphaerae bacterium]